MEGIVRAGTCKASLRKRKARALEDALAFHSVLARNTWRYLPEVWMGMRASAILRSASTEPRAGFEAG